MARWARVWTVARWVLGAAVLAAGSYILVGFWSTFNRFGVVRSLGRPPEWDAEIMFWYALPGFQAGLLVGLLLGFVRLGVGPLLLVLNLAVWAELAVNVGIIAYLVLRGALF
ncbi:MAG: hypothetical protein HY690_06280 [Chloroflexi bacterium]|nr:hypothetical protein [Chloroflexota bacterium]